MPHKTKEVGMSITVRCDEEYKGNEYTFDRKNGFWYCSKSDNWRYRYMKAYILLGCKLKQIALDQGYCPTLLQKIRPEPVEKPKAQRRTAKPKNFVPLF